MEAKILLGRGEDDALGWGRFGLADFDEVARADFGICALQAVEADDIEALILGIGPDRAGGRDALADQLDHVALGETHRGHHRARQPGDAAAAVVGPHCRDLELASGAAASSAIQPLLRRPT